MWLCAVSFLFHKTFWFSFYSGFTWIFFFASHIFHLTFYWLPHDLLSCGCLFFFHRGHEFLLPEVLRANLKLPFNSSNSFQKHVFPLSPWNVYSCFYIIDQNERLITLFVPLFNKGDLARLGMFSRSCFLSAQFWFSSSSRATSGEQA